VYIEPGSPWQNGYAESLNARLRDELPEQEQFAGVGETRLLSMRWRWVHRHERPHSSLGYRTRAEYAVQERTPIANGT
jgi:putative transposase